MCEKLVKMRKEVGWPKYGIEKTTQIDQETQRLWSKTNS